MDLRGKTALVTGGAVRVGRVIALTLAARGARIVINYRTSAAEAERTVADIRALGVDALACRADVTVAEEVARLVDEATGRFGGIDALVNNAAIFPRTPFEALTERDWDRAIDTNLKGPFLCAWRIGALMKRRGAGKIVNIADWAGVRPYRDYLPYCVSKAGVIALTKALALELAPEVQVNCVAPGPVLLPGDFTEAERRAVAEATPLKRFGSPDDVARTVLFLIEGTDFATGSMYRVDGGRLIGP